MFWSWPDDRLLSRERRVTDLHGTARFYKSAERRHKRHAAE